jgi:alkylhydroperoxidase family enzyme
MSGASAERSAASWLAATAPGPTAFDRVLALRPDLCADYHAFLALFWTRGPVDPVVLELCRLRVAQLLGCEAELRLRYEPARAAGLDEAKIAWLARWPTAAMFTDAERACLSYTERFVLDVHGITDAQAAEVARHLTPAGLVALTEALALFEGFARFRLILGVAPEAHVLAADARPVKG